MSDSAASGASSLGALAALGSLRECLAGAQNLEHLVTSRSAGPRILGQVVPDVADSLASWPEMVSTLLHSVQKSLQLSPEEMSRLGDSATLETENLVQALRLASQGPIHARSRLALEQQLRRTMPQIMAAGAQMELLAESATSRGVPMSVSELLTSTPKGGSDRPHRTVVVLGPIEQLWTALSARIGLRCLGALSAFFPPESKLALCASGHEREVILNLTLRQHEEGISAYLPILPRTETTEMCVRASLRAFGGTLEASARELRLPACAPDDKFSP